MYSIKAAKRNSNMEQRSRLEDKNGVLHEILEIIPETS